MGECGEWGWETGRRRWGFVARGSGCVGRSGDRGWGMMGAWEVWKGWG